MSAIMTITMRTNKKNARCVDVIGALFLADTRLLSNKIDQMKQHFTYQGNAYPTTLASHGPTGLRAYLSSCSAL